MPTAVIIVLIIIAVGYALALIKELFSWLARQTMKVVGRIIGSIFSMIKGIVGFVFRIITAPFHILWGLILDR